MRQHIIQNADRRCLLRRSFQARHRHMIADFAIIAAVLIGGYALQPDLQIARPQDYSNRAEIGRDGHEFQLVAGNFEDVLLPQTPCDLLLGIVKAHPEGCQDNRLRIFALKLDAESRNQVAKMNFFLKVALKNRSRGRISFRKRFLERCSHRLVSKEVRAPPLRAQSTAIYIASRQAVCVRDREPKWMIRQFVSKAVLRSAVIRLISASGLR